MITNLEGPQDRLIEQELGRLKELPFEELAAMPESAPITLGEGRNPAKAIVWRDMLEDGGVRIVVQTLNVAGACCVASLTARGFIMAPDGQVRAVPDELMDEFRM